MLPNAAHHVRLPVRLCRSFGLPLLAAWACGCSARPREPVATPVAEALPAPPASASALPKPNGAALRAEELVRQMTLDEKLAYIGGDREFYIRPVPRLGIPEIKMADGPAGCRNWGPNTAYPAAVGLAASFDTELAERVGKGIGKDCRARGVHILLAPGVNIQRSPHTGRNFEYMGEDPFLAGKTAAAFIRGVQSEGVLATVKHFAGNNQEWDRTGVSSEIDERTLREIYFPAFERSVHEGHVAAVMTAYNLLNGTFCSHHPWLLHTVLKGQWGFSGVVMSDWAAAHDAEGAAKGGLDLEMPSAVHMNAENMRRLLSEEKISVATIDDKVRRILRTMIEAGFFDRRQKRDDIPQDDPESVALSKEAAQKSIVLLKNEKSLLPLDKTKVRRIAVLGPNASPAVYGGSGSAFVTATHSVSLLDAVKSSLPQAEVLYHKGVQEPGEDLLGKPCFAGPVKQEFYEGRAFAGTPLSTETVNRIDLVRENDEKTHGRASEFSIRWTGEIAVKTKGRYRLVTNSDDGIRVYFDKKVIIEDWTDHAPKTDSVVLELAAGRHAVTVEYYQGKGGATAQLGFTADKGQERVLRGQDEISRLAKQADVVIVSVGFGQSQDTNSLAAAYRPYWPPGWARDKGLVEAEGSDRPFELPWAQVETVRLAALANPRTVVVVNAGGAVDLSRFLDKVPALLWAWYPGQEGGQALVDILLGDVNPQAKLPVTFAKRYEDYPSAPYYNVRQDNKTPYTEGVFVGYRGFDSRKILPEFAFGQGLGYTAFAYEGLHATLAQDGSVEVSFMVRNTGSRAGVEIAEVYVKPAVAKVPRPPQELKGYARGDLAAGASSVLSVKLEPRALAYWDDSVKKWAIDPGTYEIVVGSSSRDLRLTGAIAVATRTELAP